MPRHRFRSPAEWRRWLEDHHATETEAWVLLSKKADAGLHHEEALEEALCFGWIDGKIRAHDERSFAQRFSPRKEGSVLSESNRERAERLIRKVGCDPPGSHGSKRLVIPGSGSPRPGRAGSRGCHPT